MIGSLKSVITKEINGKGVLILNRPKVLNAVNSEVLQKVNSILNTWSKSKSMIIIKGNGGKAFCAGGDIRASVESMTIRERRDFFKLFYTTDSLIGSLTIPYVALIDGITMGGGAGLSVHGCYRIATEKTIFAMPETKIGLFPDNGSSYFLSRLRGNLGLYLGLTGSRLEGIDVLNAGIATHYCKSEKIPDLENALLDLENIADVSHVINNFCPRLNSTVDLAMCLPKINKCFQAKTVEEILENLEDDNSEWAKQTIKILRAVSPLSLKVAFLQFKMGASETLNECLQMEYRLTYHFQGNSDFHEGVRAMIIDKDKSPKWNPSRIEDVTDERVSSFFKPLPDNDRLPISADLTITDGPSFQNCNN